MFGVSGKTPTRPIDSFIKGDERVLWVDRFNPTRPRRRKVARWRYIRQNAYGTLCLVFVAVCAVWLAIDPTFFRQMIPELKHHKIIMIGIALIAVPFAIAAVVQDWTNLTGGERAPFDFMMTDRYLIALRRGESKPEIIPLSSFATCRLDGEDLVLTFEDTGNEVRLWDLADPAAALRAFQRGLGIADAD